MREAPGGSLPDRFAVFPLEGALLLPGGNLPLNIFEPRYLEMVRDAMRSHRIIGMIQPIPGAGLEPAVYDVGCAGRIGSFRETEDGRYLISLAGITRFDVVEELEVETPYRQVLASFRRWHGDLRPDAPPAALRPPLLEALRGYLDEHDVEAEWATIESAPLGGLITSLAMICPFRPSEKQALLEARDLQQTGEILIALLRMGSRGVTEHGPSRH